MSFFFQSIQDNEDDVDIDVGPATEISDLLGPEHEHLYPKVLYLVMADSAYYEGIYVVLMVCRCMENGILYLLRIS